MSKGPEGDGSRRKRRGGLRVPSDEVPRRASSEVAAPIPEPIGLAASISESFGVSEPDGDPQPAGKTPALSSMSDEELDELPTVVSDRNAADAAAHKRAVAAAEAAAAQADVITSELSTADISPADIPTSDRFSSENSTSPAAAPAPATPDFDAAATITDDLRMTLPMGTRALPKEESDDLDIPVDEDSDDEEVIEELEGSPLLTGEIKAIREEDLDLSSDGQEAVESGESVDIPFDDGDETTVNAPIPQSPTGAAIAKPVAAAAPDRASTLVTPADSPAAAPDAASSPAASSPAASSPAASSAPDAASSPASSAAPTASSPAAPTAPIGTNVGGKAKKKPRFNRALTMALSDSDLEEVRLEDGSRIVAKRGDSAAEAAPKQHASRAESGEVIDDSELEEVAAVSAKSAASADVAPTAPAGQATSSTSHEASDAAPAAEPPPIVVNKKRADTAEPPPPPAKAKGPSKAPPAPKPAAPKPQKPKKPKVEVSSDAEEGKRRGRKPWFEDIFDEDYLRTLPFLTPQATKFEANFVMESLGVEPGAQLLDVGCGYGRHAMELAARGYHMVGLDSSLPLLLRGADEAQRRGLTINFVHGDMREMTFESQFDGAYCLFSSFGYFDDETNKRTAQNIAKALKPGARFVVEVLNRDYLVADLPSRVWWEGDGCVVLEEVEFNYFSSRIVSNRSVVFDDGRQLEHEISLRSFSLHELGKFLHAVGFRVLEISGSMSTRGRFFGAHSRDIVVVAEKRATKSDES